MKTFRKNFIENLKPTGKSLSELKAVIFDLDGTLVDSMPFYCRAWQTAFSEQGVNVPAEEIYAHEGEKAEESVKNFYKSQRKQDIEPALREKILVRYKEVFREIYETQFYPGAGELIADIKSAGARVALVTGTSELERRFSKESGFLKNFDVIVTGADTKVGKPAPDPFLMCLKKLNLDATEVLVVENAPFGIRSAVSAGLACVAIVGSSPLTAAALQAVGALQVFPSLQNFQNELLESPKLL